MESVPQEVMEAAHPQSTMPTLATQGIWSFTPARKTVETL